MRNIGVSNAQIQHAATPTNESGRPAAGMSTPYPNLKPVLVELRLDDRAVEAALAPAAGIDVPQPEAMRQQYLQALKPDIVLVEGPPEADELLRYTEHAELKPPVAILVYQTDQLQQAVYYPFAEFSPEWQAIRWAVRRGVRPFDSAQADLSRRR